MSKNPKSKTLKIAVRP